MRGMGGHYEQHYDLTGRAFEPRQDAPRAALGPEAVEPYLVERLRAVGWQGTPVLDLALAPLLYEATGGECAAIDRAMSALLDEAAAEGRGVIAGEGLAAWLDRDLSPGGWGADLPPQPVEGLAEAQLDAIEGAFAETDRKLARLRRELAELRDGHGVGAMPVGNIEERLAAIETRLDQQEQALRHVLERLIAFFEGEMPDQQR